jgi:hypothetical protein
MRTACQSPSLGDVGIWRRALACSYLWQHAGRDAREQLEHDTTHEMVADTVKSMPMVHAILHLAPGGSCENLVGTLGDAPKAAAASVQTGLRWFAAKAKSQGLKMRANWAVDKGGLLGGTYQEGFKRPSQGRKA